MGWSCIATFLNLGTVLVWEITVTCGEPSCALAGCLQHPWWLPTLPVMTTKCLQRLLDVFCGGRRQGRFLLVENLLFRDKLNYYYQGKDERGEVEERYPILSSNTQKNLENVAERHITIFWPCQKLQTFSYKVNKPCWCHIQGLPWWLIGKEPSCQCRRHGFSLWVGKIPWRRKQQAIPVFLPVKSHGQRSLPGYSPWGCKESDMT